MEALVSFAEGLGSTVTQRSPLRDGLTICVADDAAGQLLIDRFPDEAAVAPARRQLLHDVATTNDALWTGALGGGRAASWHGL